jgi:hypothetical protein
MKLDASYPQPPPVAIPNRPPPRQPEQASARPVDRPHHDEAANNEQTRQPAPSANEAVAPQSEARAARSQRGPGEDETHEAGEREETGHHAHAGAAHRGGFSSNPTQPSSVGKLLDVIA